MSAQSLCIQIQQHTGIETILHYTCRDRNILSIQSDLLGASSIGLHNILCLTGDPPKLGNYPDATAVFDVDSIGLVNIVRRLNHGLDIGANAIGASTNFTIGVAANPGVPDIEQELRRFAYKVEAGAEYAITQPVFDLRLLESFLERIEEHRIPVIAGIWPLTSLRNAEFMKNDLRVSMPEEIMLRMAQADTPDAARARRHPDRAGDAGGRPPLCPGRAGQRSLRPLRRRRRESIAERAARNLTDRIAVEVAQAARLARFSAKYSWVNQPRASSVISAITDLRDHAIDAPCTQGEFFDGSQTKRKAESNQRRQEHQEPLPRQAPIRPAPGSPAIPIAATGMCSDLGKRAVVHHPAVPGLVDRAGLGVGRIMYAQRQARKPRRPPGPAVRSDSA